MDSVAELKAWISANVWKAEQIAGWVTSQFYRRAVHQQTSNGAGSGNLPIITLNDGTIDSSFVASTAIAEYIADTVGAMVTGNTETGISVTYQDADNTLDFDAQTAGDARYAPIAKGVTNGDSHDHNGGDGANIPNAGLVNSQVTIGSTAVSLGATAATVAGLTLTTPTIASFTNAGHDHSNAAGGGTLAAAALSTPIHAATGKTTPVDADELPLIDSAASNVLKKLTWANLKATFIGTVQTWTAVQTFITGTIVGSGSGAAAFIIDGGAAALRQVAFRTNGSNRWLLTTNSTAESGANAGSDFQIMSRTDAGGALRNDMTITRSSGAVALAGDLSAGAATFSSIQFSTVGATGSITTMGDGIWTPVITGSTTNPTVTYTTQTGRYLKWNTAVIVSCTITINTVSGGSGNVLISLPVAGNSATHAMSVFCESVDFAVTPSSIVALTTVSAATCTIQALQDNASNSPLQVSGLAAGDTIRFSGIYFASS